MTSRLWMLVGVMTACYRLGSPSRYGCLFDRSLCSTEQLCWDDELFGQCTTQQHEGFRYRVTSVVLDRLQSLLQILMSEGLNWQDEVTQSVIDQELSKVEKVPLPPAWKKASSSESLKAPYYTGKEEARSDRGAADQIQPKLQPYMDYMMVDSPQSSHLMQRLEPYTYQKYAYQDEEGRSLNLVDGDMSSIHSRGSGHRPHPLNKDTQLLQDLVSVLLSSPAQPTSHHQVATPLSTPPFFQGLNFPLDYSKDYISQVMKVSSQQHKKKTPKEHGKIAGLDGSVQKSLNDLQGGFDLSHLDTEDKGHLFAVLSHLDPEDMRRLFSVLDLLQSEPAMALRQGSQAPQKLVKMTEGATTQAEDKTPVSGRPGPSRPRVIAGGASVLGPAALMKQDEGWNRTPKPIPAKNQTKQKDEYEYLLTNQR